LTGEFLLPTPIYSFVESGYPPVEGVFLLQLATRLKALSRYEAHFQSDLLLEQLTQSQSWLGAELWRGELMGQQPGVGGGGDHGGVVGRERARRKEDLQSLLRGFLFECRAEFGVGGDASSDEEGGGVAGSGGGKRLAD
jgi:hypothetical protein